MDALIPPAKQYATASAEPIRIPIQIGQSSINSNAFPPAVNCAAA